MASSPNVFRRFFLRHPVITAVGNFVFGVAIFWAGWKIVAPWGRRIDFQSSWIFAALLAASTTSVWVYYGLKRQIKQKGL